MNTTALGIMSGTSLDGVDLALCHFKNSGTWSYEIEFAETIRYSDEWTNKLINASALNAEDFLLLHNEYGRYLGTLVNDFLNGKSTPDLICSHGHTIFHQPEKMFTFQIGNGASIAASTGITTIGDFRTMDVALGGQGAPLVPIGDKLLFNDYSYCINLGGFANISYDVNGSRIAYDICPVNIVLNDLAGKKGLLFDKDGKLGASGNVNRQLLKALNDLQYYHQHWPKSLGREWVEKNIIPLLITSNLSIEDQAATYYEHISDQIVKTIISPKKVLFTGGGSFNKYLMDRVKTKMKGEMVIPDEKLINFKEALIFAFLGVLSFSGQINCLASVTGANSDSITGTIFPVKANAFSSRSS